MLIDVGQNFVVQHDRPFLVVAGGKKLNHLPPVELVFSLKIAAPYIIETIHYTLENIIGIFICMVWYNTFA